jgi:hypothetical protein
MERRTWAINAAEFAALDRRDAWLFARLVACSVEPDDGNGNRNVRNTSGKTSARKFAVAAGTSAPRVLRYLQGWNAAAARGWVRPSSELTPADIDTPVPLDPARAFVDATGRLQLVAKKAPRPPQHSNQVTGTFPSFPPSVGRPKSALRVLTEEDAQGVVRATAFRWKGSLHTAASALDSVLEDWTQVEPHLDPDELAEVTAVLDLVEDSLLNLRSRVAGRVVP